MADMDDFFAKKDKKKKKKKSSKVDPNRAAELLQERGKDVKVSVEKAAADLEKKEADTWAEAPEEPQAAERLVTGMTIAKMEKEVEPDAMEEALEARAAGGSFIGAMKGDDALAAEAEAEAEAESAAAAAAAEPEPEPEAGDGTPQVYKPKFRSADGMMGPGSADIMSRRSNKFEMQEEMFPDLADAAKEAAKPKAKVPVPRGGGGMNMSRFGNAGGGGGYGGSPGQGGGGGSEYDAPVPAGRPRLNLSKRSVN